MFKSLASIRVVINFYEPYPSFLGVFIAKKTIIVSRAYKISGLQNHHLSPVQLLFLVGPSKLTFVVLQRARG